MKYLFPVLLLALMVNIIGMRRNDQTWMVASVVLFAIYFAGKAIVRRGAK